MSKSLNKHSFDLFIKKVLSVFCYLQPNFKKQQLKNERSCRNREESDRGCRTGTARSIEFLPKSGA